VAKTRERDRFDRQVTTPIAKHLPSADRIMPPLTPPPDRNPKTPKLKLPVGAVDTHIHLFGPASKYPFHPSSRYVSEDVLPEHNIALQDALGLGMSIIISGGGYGSSYQHLADVLREYPDRFRGVALLPPQTTRDEIAMLDRLGVRGARFVSPQHGAHFPQLASSQELIERIRESGWHIQFYPHRTDLPDFKERLLSLGSNIVLDHFAHIPADGGIDQPAFRCLLEMLESGRVWVKLSGPMRCTQEEPPYPSITPMAKALVRHAPDRLVWGSDWPHVNMTGRTMPNDGDLIDLLAEWVPDAVTRKKIMVDNPAKLYRLPSL
jgi:2-pyrone-4,6-dicarboxylate lactonase